MSYKLRAAVVGFKWSTLVLVGFTRRTTVVSFRLRTTVIGCRWRKRVVGFNWRKLGKELQCLVSNGVSDGGRTENDGGELQMENCSNRLYTKNNSGWLQMENSDGSPRKTTVVSLRWRTTALGYRQRTAVGFKWRRLVVSGLLQVKHYSGWLQMENISER